MAEGLNNKKQTVDLLFAIAKGGGNENGGGPGVSPK